MFKNSAMADLNNGQRQGGQVTHAIQHEYCLTLFVTFSEDDVVPCCIQKKWDNKLLEKNVHITGVEDPDHFDTDPDPAFHFDMDPDPVFQFDTDSDPTV
jgi:hypothetical protein